MSEDVVAAMVTADPGIIDEQRVVLDSVHSVCNIRREHWQLRIHKTERNRLFDVLKAATDDAPDQHDDHGNQANFGSSASFAPFRNSDEVKPAGTRYVELTSTDNQAYGQKYSRTWDK